MWVSPLLSSHLQLINHHLNSSQNNTLAAEATEGEPEVSQRGIRSFGGYSGGGMKRDRVWACITSAIACSCFIRGPSAYTEQPSKNYSFFSSGFQLGYINLSTTISGLLDLLLCHIQSTLGHYSFTQNYATPAVSVFPSVFSSSTLCSLVIYWIKIYHQWGLTHKWKRAWQITQT